MSTDTNARGSDPREIRLAVARSDADYEGILALQRRNLREALSEHEQAQDGFVYLQHDLPVLQRMARRLPQAIALCEGRVVGYCLALARELREEMPRLEPMFVQFESGSYRGQPLSAYRFFVGGQVCVDRDFRGQGLIGRLYRQVRDALPSPQDLCVTEIAARNRVSLSGHEKIGFRTILRYSDPAEDWVVVAWDLADRS